jgi:hypothetical protein
MKYLILFALVACASGPTEQLTKKAQNLEVYAAKPNGCKVVGKVVGLNENGSTELATNDAVNKAADLGATGVFVNQEVPNGNKRAVHATAYDCN